MPWKEWNDMSQRRELVRLIEARVVSVIKLCERFGVVPKTAYKWLARSKELAAAAEGCPEAAFADRSRRPKSSPNRTSQAMEEQVLEVRREHPAWGGRKIKAYLCHRGVAGVPSCSTITEILRRHGRIDPKESAQRQAPIRFEREAPNELWQMDFKGHGALSGGARCHPLTVLDDHSRYAIGLRACPDERGETVQAELRRIFRTHGIPRQMLMDNGSPWGCGEDHPDTWLTVWLMRLGIRVSHGRPFHPQTQGKDERFHRTLNAELLRGRTFRNLMEACEAMEAWRETYNALRPHEALGMATPASRYRPSERSFPEVLPEIEYGPGDLVRKVQSGGWLHYEGREIRLSKAFRGEPVALRRNVELADQLEVWYCQQRLGVLDLRDGTFSRRAIPREH